MDFKEWDQLYSYNGLPVKLRRDAEHELDELGILLEDVILAMKQGKPCPKRWKDRKVGHREICFKNGGMFVRVVFIEECLEVDGGNYVLIKHVGKVI